MIWIEAPLPTARAAFSTRLGGRSDGPYRSLNLGILTEDDLGLVARNRELLASALERDPWGFVMGLQVHGSEVQVRTGRQRPCAYMERGSPLAEADAQLTDRLDLTPLVLVADCVPLIMSASGAVGAVHCGWRGVAAGVVSRSLARLCELASAGASEVAVALGPGIGRCCYEVGEEVADAFRAKSSNPHIVEQGKLDLALVIRLELEQAGVDPGSIFDTGLCTSCHADLFFSHRRDRGLTGRQAGLAWRT
jgi:YfiH family protein